MNKKQRIIFLVLLLFPVSISIFAEMRMGTWKTHFAYETVSELTQSDEKIYAISNGALFSVDKEYGSIETYSKINGLSDGEISHIAYNKESDLLFIAYANCNIDILKSNDIINIPDLKRKEIPNKSINGITFDRQYAYLSCGFGIVVVDTENEEIADTYIIGENGDYLNVNSIQFAQEYIYALTETGVSYARVSNPNLSNFENWDILPDPYSGAKNIDIASFDNKLLLSKENGIYQYNGTDWDIYKSDIHSSRIKEINNELVCFNSNTFFRFDKNGNEKEQRSFSLIADLIYSPRENRYWIAHNDISAEHTVLVKYFNGQIEDTYIPDGPYSTKVAFLKYEYGKLITGSGGRFDLAERDNPGIVQLYGDNKWVSIRQKDLTPGITNPRYNFLDILDAVLDPTDPRRMYVSGWTCLYEFYDNELIKHYTPENSNLETANSYGDVLIDGLLFDKNNNLWMINMLTQNLLKVKKADGTWTSVYYSKISKQETGKKLFTSSNGYKWILFPRAPGLFVINDKGTPFSTSDDQTSWFTSFQEISNDGVKTVSPKTYRCIAEDQNKALWIGTDIGPLIVSNPDNIFSSSFSIDRIKITREDDETLADYLLGTERINAIVVDGGNRKWIGTASSGVYLLSPNGQETIHHFTTENSPLISNSIIDMVMNDESGEVFIATSTGLFSYKSDATTGADSYSDVYAYPNPVRENYHGPITIKGLMAKSVVKIADIRGNVIYQGNSNGGIFTWDGKNMHGKRVATGVYLVFAALDDGSEKMVTKIAFIN